LTRKYLLFLIFFLYIILFPVCWEAFGETRPKTIVHRFFTLVHRRNYKEAYKQFSRSVRKEVSFSRFIEGAQDVKYLKILRIIIQDREENLIKIKIRAIMHLAYKGNLYEAIYEGKMDLYREKDGWKVLRVRLKAVSQKPLNIKAPPGKLQRLDFGGLFNGKRIGELTTYTQQKTI